VFIQNFIWLNFLGINSENFGQNVEKGIMILIVGFMAGKIGQKGGHLAGLLEEVAGALALAWADNFMRNVNKTTIFIGNWLGIFFLYDFSFALFPRTN
jgi:hypothetical protein